MSSRVEISKKLVAINSASSVVTNVVNISILVWLHQYLLRRISPEEYSIYPVVLAAMVFVPLMTVILTSGLGRYIVEAYAKGDERRVTQIVSTMFPLLLGAGVVVLGLGLTFAWYVDRILTIPAGRVWDARIMMALMISSGAIRLPAAVFGVGLYVRQKFVLLNFIGLCESFLRIALLLILLLGVSTRVLWVVVASVSSGLCGLVVSVMISRRLVPALRFQVNEIYWPLAKTLLSFGSWSFVGQLANTIRTASDAIILNKLGTPLDVTCFHMGSFPKRQIEQMIGLAQGPIQPALTAMHATEKHELLRKSYLRVGRYALWGILLAAFPAIIYRHEIVGLYIGAEFDDAATVISLLLLGFPFYAGHILLPAVAHATGRISGLVCRSIIIQTTNLLLTLYLVGSLKMGAKGAALASLAVGTPGTIFILYPYALKLVDVRFKTWIFETFLPGIVPGLVATLVWVVTRKYYTLKDWGDLAFCVAPGVVVYLSVLLFCCLQPNDKKDLQKVWIKSKDLLIVPSQ